MSLIDKVVYYLNDVLVSLDIAPIQKTGAKGKTKTKELRDSSDINA
ncbi:hypothetical protein U8527_19345 [Kordia algicida OT-1]|uniref:Uncharacterized protein n=1 Tax=Kordia algicida OT-1 TaxID=391587 RepID=A9DJR1_9FLAO|nr:hypothetical protein [Kordia algicida]EDP98163.1 hypothetical protein KAOT1_13137 [Kordia algicida OT-1]